MTATALESADAAVHSQPAVRIVLAKIGLDGHDRGDRSNPATDPGGCCRLRPAQRRRSRGGSCRDRPVDHQNCKRFPAQ